MAGFGFRSNVFGRSADRVGGGNPLLTVDPYRAYEESSVAGGNPVNLVVALYEGAVTSIRSAKACLNSGDIMARGKAITKAVNILSELLASLDHEKAARSARVFSRSIFISTSGY